MRVLIIEDEKEIADGIKGILTARNYAADAVYDGEEGLAFIRSDVYDIILLDVMLPKMNGFEVIKQARSEGIPTPVIMLTAKSQIEDKINGLELGADDYLTKPFDAGELLARIKARLRKNANLKDNILSAYDLELDLYSYQLKKGVKTIKLSKTEYLLLQCLMVNKEQIIPRDTLISKVWGFDENGDYNNLDVYISFLRKKMKFIEAKAVILTQKGVGYYLAEGEDK